MNCRVSFKEWLRSNEFTNKERITVVFSYEEVLLLMETEPAGAAVGDDRCRKSANIGFDSMTSLCTCGTHVSTRLPNSFLVMLAKM